MGQVSSKLRRGTNGYFHWCPACDEMHPLPDSWTFNGDLEHPTFSPSFRHDFVKRQIINHKWTGEWERDSSGNTIPCVCHYILSSGQLYFQNDCTHALAGATVPLSVLPRELTDEVFTMNIKSTIDLYAKGPVEKGPPRQDKKKKVNPQKIDEGSFVSRLRDKVTMYVDKDTGEIQPPDVNAEGDEEDEGPELGPISRKRGKQIVQNGTQYCVKGNPPDTNLGCYPSEEKALLVKNGRSFIEDDIQALDMFRSPGSVVGHKKKLKIGKVGHRTPNPPMANGRGVRHHFPNPSMRAGGPGSGRKKDTFEDIRRATPKERSDPRQKSLYGPKHERELQDYYKKKGIKSFADLGEPMAGALGHAHLDPVTFFRPPSLRNSKPVPTDSPRETDNKYLDVTKRNSKDTKKMRNKLIKHQAPGGTPAQIPAHTTLIAPHTATYMPGMFGRGIRTRPILPGGRKRLISKSYVR